MPILKMMTGLCGPDYSLVRGDEREFDEIEASSLIRAGFAVATDGFVPLELPAGDEPVADAGPAAEPEAVSDAEPPADAEPAAEPEAEPEADAEPAAEPAADAEPRATPAPAARRRRS